jgi:peroxiredoxin
MLQPVPESYVTPDFELTDTQGHAIRLSAFRGRAVVLVLLRGFV